MYEAVYTENLTVIEWCLIQFIHRNNNYYTNPCDIVKD